jgi:outer membrane protein OmpA-like peptidoglycan-associated protein
MPGARYAVASLSLLHCDTLLQDPSEQNQELRVVATPVTGAPSCRRGIRALVAAVLLPVSSSAFAGDPVAVNEVLGAVHGNWQDSSFTIDVTGVVDHAAITGSSLQVRYEAAKEGYLTWLRVSSHGDMVATSVNTTAGTDSGTVELPIKAPLGHEQTFFLFSAQPLKALTGEAPQAALGADRDHADAVARRITELESQGKIALRWIGYMVDAPAGQTEYTTRSIVRIVAGNGGAPEAQHARGLPTRIEFQFNSDRLTEASQRNLDVFGAAMLEMPDRRVLLEGYADAVGTDAYDLKLSRRRAEAARYYLMDSFGLPATHLEARGKGKLGAPTDPAVTRKNYRRVDFVFGRRSPQAGPAQRDKNP